MQASSIDLMRAETEAASATPSWMDIRFDHTLLPPEEVERRERADGAFYLDGENKVHPALDPHAQRSSARQNSPDDDYRR